MKKMTCVIMLLTVMVLAAGCTAGPAGPTVSPTPGPLAEPEDPIIGSYGADVNDNRLVFNQDNTFRMETPGQSYVGVWQKMDNNRYSIKYTDPQTGEQIEKVLIYDTNDRSLNFEGEPTVDYVKDVI